MVDAIVSVVLDQLISTTVEEAKERVRLVAGVDREVNSLREDFEAIRAVMVDAEERQWKEEWVRLWLKKLKHASYDMEDVLDVWNTARIKLKIKDSQTKKVRSFFPAASCFGVKQIVLRHDIAVKIKEIKETVNKIARDRDLFKSNEIRSVEKSELSRSTTALTNMSKVCGRDEENNIIKSKLLCEGSAEQNAVQIISLVGMGGIGKTTLAQYAINDSDVIDHFPIRMWVCVSDPFDELKVAKAIIEALEGSATNLVELNSLLLRINTSIAGKRFLLVLDDVWTEDYCKWESFHNCLMNGLFGSKILVTTRKETTAEMMQSIDFISIKRLPEHQCWSLFEGIAFSGRSCSESDYEQLQEIGKKIVKRCKGLPLAVKTIASLLLGKKSREEWQIILNRELWQIKKFEKFVIGLLLLSYNDLCSYAKQCFSYCAVFPKDYNLKKDELVRLWIAQGYIKPKKEEDGKMIGQDMEMIGQEYFNVLAARSFFQEFQYDEGIIMRCKMHDIVHDFARFVQMNGSEESVDREKFLHLNLVLDKQTSIPDSIPNAGKLRSLLIFGEVKVDLLPGLFNQMPCLRTLKIENIYSLDAGFQMMINEHFKGIGKLIHLRYLQLGAMTVEELPKTCCELFNLQTLDIRGFTGCKRNRETVRLPQGIGKLVNLRHLLFRIDGLEYMPKGIERLTSLMTLTEFVVVRRDGIYGSKACKLDGLKKLNHLGGSLTIRGLGNITDVDEAKNAHLEEKEKLDHLELSFFDRNGERLKEEMDHEEIIEALRPPPNLKSLVIKFYGGKTLFPNWTTSLNRLKDLRIGNCNSLETMPRLGKLPSLEVLELWGLGRIKRVDDEFLGSSGTSSSITAFPKLKTLTFEGFYIWEEWDFGKEDIAIMPQLNFLRIKGARKLKSIPDQLLRSTTMKKLEIIECTILKKRLFEEGGDWSKISHIPKIRFDDHLVRRETY